MARTLAIVSLLALVVSLPRPSAGCTAREKAALLSFKAGITGDPDGRLASWSQGDCCLWAGIRCDARSGRVTGLDLRNRLFQDDFVFTTNPHALRGEIGSSLLALPSLRYLDLSGNDLGGPDVPPPAFLGSLRRLRYLNLSYVDFHGPVPPHLGELSELRYLDIRAYELGMYADDVSWLSRLPRLRHLDMSFINLTTVLDWASVVNTLPELRVLRLNTCWLKNSNQSIAHVNLTKLETLDLSGNYLSNPIASSWFWGVTSLRSLLLGECRLYGSLPDAMGNLTSLEALHVGYNFIDVMLPATLEKLCNLKILDLSGNDIGGDIAEFMSRIPRCAWSNLSVLMLDSANMTGSLPDWLGQMTGLSTLDLYNNQLAGAVPSGIGALANLTYLKLGLNSLSGAITEEHFSSLVNLKFIGLSHNSLRIAMNSSWVPPFRLESASFASCEMGPRFPAWIKWQPSILSLDISNTSIVDQIPDWFWTVFSNAKFLDISHNQISGELPATTMEAMSAEQIHLSSNNLTGSIPQLPMNLKVLDASANFFSGQRPSNFGAPQLGMLVLFSNLITGAIPASICGLQYLEVLDLSSNLLEGELPRCETEDEGSSTSLRIVTLALRNNNLSGEFPSFMQKCKYLTFLDLAYNKFSGSIPTWIQQYPSLAVLQLRSNLFSGHIPEEITRLGSLQYLDLACNNISGTIPRSLANLQAMTHAPGYAFYPFANDLPLGGPYGKPASSFGDSLQVVIKGQELQYNAEVYMVSLDLSCNSLTGEIPEEIGSLDGLIGLNLSWNLLTGEVPGNIGNLRPLESLDLSENELSGEIPMSLVDLTSLSYLNLSYNNLSGRIPSGNQLDTLNTDNPGSMYFGNTGLCGPPLLRNCSGSKTARDEYNDGFSVLHFYTGLSMGFVFGLWLVFCAFLLKASLRISYFELFDRVCDKTCSVLVATLANWCRRQPELTDADSLALTSL